MAQPTLLHRPGVNISPCNRRRSSVSRVYQILGYLVLTRSMGNFSTLTLTNARSTIGRLEIRDASPLSRVRSARSRGLRNDRKRGACNSPMYAVGGSVFTCPAIHSCPKPRNRGHADVVAAGKVAQCRALCTALAGFMLLRGEGRGAAHMLPTPFGAVPALCTVRVRIKSRSASASAENGNHLSTRCWCWCRPRPFSMCKSSRRSACAPLAFSR
jgi:hypothetical protein